MENNLKWNFEEFTSYLLLYAANSDLEFSPEEEKLIKSRISDESYEAIKKQFDEANDFQHIQTILDYKGLYFPTAERAGELIDLITNLFNVDGHFLAIRREQHASSKTIDLIEIFKLKDKHNKIDGVEDNITPDLSGSPLF